MLNMSDTLKNLIKSGESTIVEFKETKEKLPTDLFESICGMLNRIGGHIFLGIKDDGTIIGIKTEIIQDLKKNFVTLCNNAEKIFPTVRLEINEYYIENKCVLYIYVYESSNVHKTKNKIFDRNEDGDFDITNNPTLVSNLYIRKSNTYIENKIYPYATMDDLRVDLIDRVRKMAINRTPGHPWGKMDNMELLRSVGFYDRDLLTGESGYNLACILLFGKDETIKSVISYYKTDAILRVEDLDRYDDRDDIRTNLLESFDRLYNFIIKHLNEKFYLEGTQRIDVRSIIAREVCVNLLVHREFSNQMPAKLIITPDKLVTENANKPVTVGYIDVNNYAPYPKNPKIANVFKEIGLADELGSGIKKIFKYTNIYSGGVPLFRDDDIFTVEIPLKVQFKVENGELNDIKDRIYNFIKASNGVSNETLNAFLRPLLDIKSESEFIAKRRYIIDNLKRNGYIDNIGARKKPIWIANDIKTR